MIPQAKAVEILEELSSRINLVKAGRHTNAPNFVKWHRDTEAAIQNIFPGKSEYLLRFKSIEYKMQFDARVSERGHEEYFSAALDRANAILRSLIEEIQLYWEGTHSANDKNVQSCPIDTKKVFVVHGRNETIRRAIFDFLRCIKLEPIEWSEAVKATGEASPYIGTVLDKAFIMAQAVVIIMTPDDLACLREEFQTEQDEDYEKYLTPQARPNVLFEAGMAFGRDASRTVLVQIGKLRPFSDITGRHVLKFDGSTQRRQELAERLKTAGCDTSLVGTDWHTTGSFELVDAKQENSPAARKSATDLAISKWKNDFLDTVVVLKTTIMRNRRNPGDWYPVFESSIIELTKFVAKIPKSENADRKREISEIVVYLSQMDDAQVVYGSQDVFVLLEKLEALTHEAYD